MLITADLHYGVKGNAIPAGLLDSRIVDTSSRLKEIFAKANNMNESVVIAGDVFDNSRPSSVVTDEFLRVLASSKVPVYIIPGNHDCDTSFSAVFPFRWAGLKNVHIVESACIKEIDGLKCAFIPHIPKSVYYSIIEMFGSLEKYYWNTFEGNAFDVCISHCTIAGMFPEDPEIVNPMVFYPNEFPQAKLYVFGHIHKAKELSVDGRTIIYPGALMIRDFSEADHTIGYLHVMGGLVRNEALYYVGTGYRKIKIDLVNKDTLKLDPAKVRAISEGNILSIEVYAKDRMLVESDKIISTFSEASGVVSQFRIIAPEDASEDVSIEVSDTRDWYKIYDEWLAQKAEGMFDVSGDAEIKALFDLGKLVIDEVLCSVK